MTTTEGPVRHQTNPAARQAITPGNSAVDPPVSTAGHGGQSFSGGGLLYTVDQAAVMLAVRPSWLVRKARAGAIPCHRIGKHLRFSPGDLDQILHECSRPAAAPENNLFHMG